MKKLYPILFIFLTAFTANAEIYYVKFKDGKGLYGHLYSEVNFSNFAYGDSNKTEIVKFKEMLNDEYVDVKTRSIDYFLFRQEGKEDLKYFALPVRSIDKDTGELKNREDMTFLNLIVDGPLQLYGSHHVDALPYEKNLYKMQHSFEGNSTYFFKTADVDYAISTKPQIYGSSWPGYSTISSFLNNCPKAKKIFDEKYPGGLWDKRRYEVMIHKDSKTFDKQFKKELKKSSKKIKKIDRDLIIFNASRENSHNTDLKFYIDVVDIYNSNCVN